ncbi:MAG TPA: hypothetical protein VK963_02550 [Candidatus Saccharimonadales bacterium]|nr:hypothetical protein [Candidatus Saccharimonadales bacterium]
MEFAENVFKAYDIRGLVPDELTPELARNVGRALADLLPTPGPVAVGRDMRPDSAQLARELIAGLTEQGREVWDIGQVTSDMIYFAAGHFNLAGGAMVTASHNPGQYNGIKLCAEGARPIGVETGLQDIKAAIAADRYMQAASLQGVSLQKNVTEDWIKHVLSFIDPHQLKRYRLAVDAGNGMAGAIVPHLEPQVPFEVTRMYFELDGTFPNHPASPIELENLQDLIQRIKKDRLDFGIAFDGDGDRAFLVDELGQPVSGSVMTAILAEHFLSRHTGATILYNVICSRVVPETITKLGGKAIRTKVGHSYIKADMRTHKAIFAGEHSGHYYFKNNFNADSGLLAVMVAIDVLSQSGLTLSQLAGKYRTYFESGEINSTVESQKSKVESLAAQYADGEQDRLDGLTVNYPDWWFNVRPSNTEPLLRLNVEANSRELMEAKRDELLALIRA